LFDASDETLDHRERGAAALGVHALVLNELARQIVDHGDARGEALAAAGLLLSRELDLLGDATHALAALHDELAAAGLLCGGGGDLLHGLGDAADGVGDLL